VKKYSTGTGSEGTFYLPKQYVLVMNKNSAVNFFSILYARLGSMNLFCKLVNMISVIKQKLFILNS
jgi:hypothetical protein